MRRRKYDPDLSFTQHPELSSSNFCCGGSSQRHRVWILYITLLLSCHPVTVFSMSLLVRSAAASSSSSSPPRGSTTTAVVTRASMRPDDGGSSIDQGRHHHHHNHHHHNHRPSLITPRKINPSSPSFISKPFFSLRNWFAPRRIQPLSMASGTTTATTTTTSILTIPLAPPLAEENVPTPVVGNSAAKESVHLQLTGLKTSTTGVSSEEETPPTTPPHQQPSNQTLIQVHSVVVNGKTYVALNTPKHKFQSFLQYILNDHNNTTTTTNASAISTSTSTGSSKTAAVTPTGIHSSNYKITTSKVAYDAQVRQEWRDLWKQRQLVTDRTELLAIYPSDIAAEVEEGNDNSDGNDASSFTDESPTTLLSSGVKKRGGFADLLHLYTERFAAILSDEQMQEQEQLDLIAWLESNYGVEETLQLQTSSWSASSMSSSGIVLSEQEQLQTLKHFLEWFRNRFPYFYDRCGSCGASMKEDLASSLNHHQHVDHHDNSPIAETVEDDDNDNDTLIMDVTAVTVNGNSSQAVADDTTGILSLTQVLHQNNEDETDNNDNEDEEEQDDEEEEIDSSEYHTFIGYMYPSEEELLGKASRTELYRCHVCQEFTRFPRFNSAHHVLEQRRGRCGEYSMLLYRFLRALNHPCRWVVDWSDHVWAEILVTATSTGGGQQQRWVHLDPCEAAVDQNLLYQDWGKKQTFILGFAAPPPLLYDGSPTSSNDSNNNTSIITFPLIEDITSTYTSDSWETICKRRDEHEDAVRACIEKTSVELKNKLANIHHDRSS